MTSGIFAVYTKLELKSLLPQHTKKIFLRKSRNVGKQGEKTPWRKKNNRQKIRDKRFVSPLKLFFSSPSPPPMLYYDTCVCEIFVSELKGRITNGESSPSDSIINIVYKTYCF